MSFSNDLWNKFSESKEFREEYVAALAKRAFAHQVKMIRKGREMSQEEFAATASIEQGVISRAENPNYGNLTFNTGFRISAGFDLAFIPLIVTYSEFLKWAETITEGIKVLPSFEQENQALERGESLEKATLPKKPAKSVHPNYYNPNDLAYSGRENNVVEITAPRKNQIEGKEMRELMQIGVASA